MRVPKVRQLLVKTSLLILFVITGLLPQKGYARTQSLSVAVLSIDEQQMAVYSDMFDVFELRHPDIKVEVDFYNDGRYKKLLSTWLESGEYDVLYWQGGRRLKSLIEREQLKPISQLVDKNQLADFFHPGSLQDITVKGDIYAIPLGHYPWGFYYNKVLFEQSGLAEPTNWQEFLRICEVLSKAGVPPLIQASKDNWPLLGWLDYLAYEAGGESLRSRLINSDTISDSDASLLMNLFSPLIKHNYFFAPDFDWEWSQTIAVLMRRQAAMTLMGQFADTVIPPHLTEEIGYFSFPFSDPANAMAVSPLELWVVPQSGGNRIAVEHLLRYLNEKEVHEAYALQLGLLPVSKVMSYGPLRSKRLEKGAASLHSAERHVQYFDRDAKQEVSDRISLGMQSAIREALPEKMRVALTQTNSH